MRDKELDEFYEVKHTFNTQSEVRTQKFARSLRKVLKAAFSLGQERYSYPETPMKVAIKGMGAVGKSVIIEECVAAYEVHGEAAGSYEKFESRSGLSTAHSRIPLNDGNEFRSYDLRSLAYPENWQGYKPRKTGGVTIFEHYNVLAKNQNLQQISEFGEGAYEDVDVHLMMRWSTHQDYENNTENRTLTIRTYEEIASHPLYEEFLNDNADILVL